MRQDVEKVLLRVHKRRYQYIKTKTLHNSQTEIPTLETGSLISIKANVDNILIPSEEDSIEMFPTDFEEFLWAMGDELMWPAIVQHYEKGMPMGEFHRDAMRYFREYMIVFS